MSLVAGGVGAIIALLLSQGFTQVKAFADTNGDTTLTGLDQNGKPINVQLKNNAVISPQYDFVRISANQNEKSDDNAPQYFLKNTSSVIKRIFSISIVPDATFKAEGFLQITLNGVTFFPITNPIAGNFQDVDSITIPILDTYGLKILPKDELRVFIWSATGATINATIAVFIGELP